jgi:hypothetical protein
MNRATAVDPQDLFARLARELPTAVRDHVFVVGSLAAACRHASRIEGGRVRTKDADLVIHPASEVAPAALIAVHLRGLGWLGRVLALARLESREETERWALRWRFALETCFPTRWPKLAAHLGT